MAWKARRSSFMGLSLSALQMVPGGGDEKDETMTVDVLFARSDSIYKSLGCEVWDLERDARLYDGRNPVVAHPPCRAWGSLSYWAKPRSGERVLARIALEWVRRNCGVLEHPQRSKLWLTEDLPVPGLIDAWGGFTFPVDQNWWGHKARKRTLLYVCGIRPSDLPPIPLDLRGPTHSMGLWSGRDRKRALPTVPKNEFDATPIAFAKWLVAVAEGCI